MAAPVLQAYTMRRGDLTRATAGGATLSQFMLASGSAVVTWSVTAGSMTNLAIDAATGSITPTAAGGWGSSQRVFTIRGTNADGFSEAALTVDIVASAYSVSTPLEIDSTGTAGLRTTTIKAGMGGKSVIISRGTFAAWNGNGGTAYNTAFECLFRAFNTHTGRFTVRPEFPEDMYPSISRLDLVGCVGMDIVDLGVETWLSAANTSSNAQNMKAMTCTFNSLYGACRDITFTRCYGGAPVTANQPQQWVGAINVTGQPTTPYVQCSNIEVDDCHFQRVKDGWTLSTANTCYIHDSTITDFCSNASFWALELADNLLENCIHFRGWHNAIDTGDHPDNDQVGGGWGSSGVRSNCVNNNSIRNMFIASGGDSCAQGPFYDDVSYYLSTVTGFYQNNCSIENMFTDTAQPQACHMDGGSGWSVQRNTSVLGECWSILPTSTPKMLAAVVTVSGTAANNFVMNRGTEVVGYFPTFDTDNTVAITGFSPNPWNNTLRLSYLTPYFQDPTRTPDWPNLTAVQAAQQCREMFAPILNGPLKNGNGTYRSAFFPDGTWNDGTVYQATPPSNYTLTCPDTTTVISDPVTLTVQLDAAAAGSIVFTPHVSGVTGTFSPTTLTLTIGQASGSIDFTPTSAGAASLTTTNSIALPNPSAVPVTVTTPSNAPTTFTQVASRTVLLVGVPVLVTYTLDKPATSPVTITPASTVPGGFSTPTVVIQVGATVGGASFTASAYTPGTLTAANDSSLANPSAINLTAVPRRLALRLH